MSAMQVVCIMADVDTNQLDIARQCIASGIRACYANLLHKLRIDIDGTGFEYEIPMDVHDMKEFSWLFAEKLVRARPDIRDSVLEKLHAESGHPRRVEFVKAKSALKYLDAQHDESADSFDQDSPLSGQDGDFFLPEWQRQRVQVLTGWDPSKPYFDLCKNSPVGDDKKKRCLVHFRSLALTASLWRLDSARSETRAVLHCLHGLLEALLSCLKDDVHLSQKRHALSLRIGSLLRQFRMMKEARNYADKHTLDEFDRMQRYLDHRVPELLPDSETLIADLKRLYDDVSENRHVGNALVLSKDLCDLVSTYVERLKLVLEQRENAICLALKEGLLCEPTELDTALHDVIRALGDQSYLSVWAPGKGHFARRRAQSNAET